MTEKEFTKHYLVILNSSSIEDIQQREKVIRTEVQALADIDGISFENALNKIKDVFTEQYFQESDEKVATQLQAVTTSLMMMQMLMEEHENES